MPNSIDEIVVPIEISDVELDEYEDDIEVMNGSITIHHLLFGDVTMNDDVSALDAAMVLRYLVDLEDFDMYQELSADVTMNDTISALDASVISPRTVFCSDSIAIVTASIGLSRKCRPEGLHSPRCLQPFV